MLDQEKIDQFLVHFMKNKVQDEQINLNRSNLSAIYAIFIFLLFFFLIPFNQLNHLNLMPGDLGDARLNNYFLENIHLYFKGMSDSLWHLGFFYPFPFTGGFSDNLFGSSPIYIFFRALNIKSDTAFQFWFFAGYLFNFIASYYSFRRLGGKPLAAGLGALIFSFALPTSAHAGHAQLHYRFGLPLSLTFLVFFLKDKEPRNFIIFLSWLVWQFYCGIYMGFYTLVMGFILFSSYLFIYRKPNCSLNELKLKLREIFKKFSVANILLIIFLFLALFLLFYPYIQVSNLYGVKRSWSEISLMLPRLQSYFLFESSKLWKFFNFSAQLPMRHEHQMFFGFIPILLALYGFFIYARQQKKSHEFSLIAPLIPILFLLTLSISGFSLWFFFHKLPLFSAIRAITRIDQAMLFPLGYLAMLAVNKIETKPNGLKIIWLAIIPFMLVEFSFVNMATSIKSDWRSRIFRLEKILPREIPQDKVVFFAARGGPFYADEIDAMWISLIKNIKTINGYSGIYPPNYSIEYGRACSEIPKRLEAYMKFSDTEDHVGKYEEFLQKVIPIGFVGCDSM